MRLRTIAAMALIGLPVLVGCDNGASTDESDTTSAATATSASSASPAAPVSSAPPAPGGPVLNGTTYSIVLPTGSKLLEANTSGWSRSFQLGLYLDGQFIEYPCDCRATDDAKGLNRLAKEAIRFDKVTHSDVRRAADVTLAGQRFAHVTGYDHSSAVDTHVDSYESWYAGREIRIELNYRGDKARYAKLKALVDESLATFHLKG